MGDYEMERRALRRARKFEFVFFIGFLGEVAALPGFGNAEKGPGDQPDR